MTNSPKIKAAIRAVAAEINAMSREELVRMFEEHQPTEWYDLLLGANIAEANEYFAQQIQEDESKE